MYRALDARLDRVVALKVLQPDTASDADRTRRFVREAKAASALNHPNIVTVYEIDSAEGIDFIALEFVDGTPLQQVIAGRPLEPARALDYASQIADALGAAHAAGIVHRDLKPANIMVTKSSGRDGIKVLDFGLAKRVDALPSDGATFSALTRHGAVMGTPAYMAPEQAQGHPVNALADMFAFGAVFYEMLGGRMAFSRDSEINTLMAVLSGTPAPLEGVPAELIGVITRCLEKNPQARYASGTELRAALAECRIRPKGETEVHEFGPYRIDVGLSRLECAGEPITIPPKTFDLLVLLARNTHRVMTKTELMETLWPNTFVEEGNLTQHIYTLRKALGDRPGGKPYIETVPRRGYRLVAEVRGVSGVADAAKDTVPHPAAPPPTAATPSRAAVVAEGERKRASVLHCGLANASDIAERLGSVEMHQLIEQMLAAGREEVARYDGVITQTQADGFVAVFGARERAIEAATEAGDLATLGKAHGLLALEGHWSGQTKGGIAHGAKAVKLLKPRSDQRWWLGMTHFYLAMNYLLTGQFDTALEEAARANAVGRDIGDPRLQTYAGFTVGWVETSRGRSAEAIVACRRALEQAPDRVSRAYASMILGWALLEHGEHLDALERLQPIVAEIESFGFPQWQALAGVFAAEALRREGRLAEAESMAERGLRVAIGSEYWYAVGFAQRTASLILREQGRVAEADAKRADAVGTFERIGAAFEAQRSR